MKLLTSVAALLSTAYSCCSMAAAFTAVAGPSATTVRSSSQLMQQYGEDAYGNYDDQSQYYDNQQQAQYYDEQQQQQNQQYYDAQQQQQYGGEEEPTLLITDNMQEEMQRATANSDIGGLDYLALARARAAARVESVNNQSTDQDWQRLADEKTMEQGGYVSGDEAWEASLGEEGSESDFASLGMGALSLTEGEGGVMTTEGGLVVDNFDGDDEPQLLL